MSAAVMTERLAETSPRFKARLAGLFCLLHMKGRCFNLTRKVRWSYA